MLDSPFIILSYLCSKCGSANRVVVWLYCWSKMSPKHQWMPWREYCDLWGGVSTTCTAGTSLRKYFKQNFLFNKENEMLHLHRGSKKKTICFENYILTLSWFADYKLFDYLTISASTFGLMLQYNSRHITYNEEKFLA